MLTSRIVNELSAETSSKKNSSLDELNLKTILTLAGAGTWLFSDEPSLRREKLGSVQLQPQLQHDMSHGINLKAKNE